MKNTVPPIIRAECFQDQPAVVFGMSTRQGGTSPEPLGMNLSFSVGDDEANVLKNRETFFGSLEIRLDELAIPRQVHGSTVCVAREPGTYPACDALITNARRVFLCISVADCVPIFLFDAEKKVVAGIHAGWKGTAERIVEHAIHKMNEEFQTLPTDIVGFVGPSAGECCYEVGEEVAARFDSNLIARRNGRIALDLKRANTAQLLEAGVPSSAIEISSACTIHEADLLHSHRRDKEKSGRMMATIGLL